jgi:hypothetical protein
MHDIVWSPDARLAAAELPGSAQHDLARVIGLVQQFPGIGRVEVSGSYRGYRTISVGRQWRLYYQVQSQDDVCVIVGIRNMRRRPV